MRSKDSSNEGSYGIISGAMTNSLVHKHNRISDPDVRDKSLKLEPSLEGELQDILIKPGKTLLVRPGQHHSHINLA